MAQMAASSRWGIASDYAPVNRNSRTNRGSSPTRTSDFLVVIVKDPLGDRFGDRLIEPAYGA
jgi:hypothetical protein